MVTRAMARRRQAIVLVEQAAGLGLRRVRVRDRLLARIRTSALDHQLAAGASPESSVALALHAAYLCREDQRLLLARSLSEIAEASEVPARRHLKTPICRQAVRRARAELAALVDRLGAMDPVDVCGVARIRNLLTDGTGPLYREVAPGGLNRELLAALRAMDSVI